MVHNKNISGLLPRMENNVIKDAVIRNVLKETQDFGIAIKIEDSSENIRLVLPVDYTNISTLIKTNAAIHRYYNSIVKNSKEYSSDDLYKRFRRYFSGNIRIYKTIYHCYVTSIDKSPCGDFDNSIPVENKSVSAELYSRLTVRKIKYTGADYPDRVPVVTNNDIPYEYFLRNSGEIEKNAEILLMLIISDRINQRNLLIEKIDGSSVLAIQTMGHKMNYRSHQDLLFQNFILKYTSDAYRGKKKCLCAGSMAALTEIQRWNLNLFMKNLVNK